MKIPDTAVPEMIEGHRAVYGSDLAKLDQLVLARRRKIAAQRAKERGESRGFMINEELAAHSQALAEIMAEFDSEFSADAREVLEHEKQIVAEQLALENRRERHAQFVAEGLKLLELRRDRLERIAQAGEVKRRIEAAIPRLRADTINRYQDRQLDYDVRINGVCSIYSAILAANAALADWPDVAKAMADELARLDGEIAAFVERTGIKLDLS